jgi:transcriptional regulator with XRE-family HTH domain
MNTLSKEEKLRFILRYVKEKDLSAYELGMKTGLNVSGLTRLVKGDVKNPNKGTVNILYNYITNLPEFDNQDIVREPTSRYVDYNLLDCIKEQRELMLEINLLTREIVKLQNLLSRNNISFQNIFENEELFNKEKK